jgi:exosortase E/protease (VPEID-CTERM system)
LTSEGQDGTPGPLVALPDQHEIPPVSSRRIPLSARLALVAAGLFLEKFLLSFFMDSGSAGAARGIGAAAYVAQHWAFYFLVTLAVSLSLFAHVRGSPQLLEIDAAARAVPLRWRWLLAHVALLPPLAALTFLLYSPNGDEMPFVLVLGVWAVLAIALVLTLLAAAAPWILWHRGARKLGGLWLYALAAAAASAAAMQWTRTHWAGMEHLTFDGVRLLLTPFLPNVQADPATLVIDTGRFAVQIMAACSGVEGMGLMLAFCSVWLLLFRKEYIFPRALVLIPASLVLIFVLNVVRISLLVLLGHVGFEPIAVYGFHSQAGWIAFNCAAGFVASASRRSPALNLNAKREAIGVENPTATYLVPFLAILAAGMLAAALSSGFEALYALRPIAAGLALYRYWPRLRRLQWRVTWRGPAVGIVAFVVWVMGARLHDGPEPMPAELATMPVALSLSWIAIRAIASATVVPLAEELAFRGFLMRRLVAADFQAVPYQSVGIGALLLSAIVFGFSHGTMWFPAIVAGLLYGVVTRHSGTLGEAVSAHATTNALIAALVLFDGRWQLWGLS